MCFLSGLWCPPAVLMRRRYLIVQVRWESDITMSGWRNEHATAKHYRGLFNKRPSVTWQEVLNSALAERRNGVQLPFVATSTTPAGSVSC